MEFLQNVIDEGPKVIASAAVLAAIVPTKYNKDNLIGKILNVLGGLVNLLAFNFGKAKNKEVK